MKTQKQIHGIFHTKLLVTIVLIGLMGIGLPTSKAVIVTYTFDNPGDTTSNAVDSQTADGALDGKPHYGDWVLVPGVGPAIGPTTYNTTAAYWPYPVIGNGYVLNVGGFVGAAPDINYGSGLTWSADINPAAAAPSGETTLFWAGWERGAGESRLYFDATGRLVYTQAGLGGFTSTATGLLQSNQWNAVGMTYDPSAGGTIVFYTNGVPLQTFSSVGAFVNNGNASSSTIFGQPFNLGGSGAGGAFTGFGDNIFIADFALSAQEMFDLQAHIPEPSTVMLLGLGGLLLRRRMKRSAG